MGQLRRDSSLSHKDIVALMDHLTRLEATFLDGNTSAHTIFLCYYTHDVSLIQRADLKAFILLLLRTTDFLVELIRGL